MDESFLLLFFKKEALSSIPALTNEVSFFPGVGMRHRAVTRFVVNGPLAPRVVLG